MENYFIYKYNVSIILYVIGLKIIVTKYKTKYSKSIDISIKTEYIFNLCYLIRQIKLFSSKSIKRMKVRCSLNNLL